MARKRQKSPPFVMLPRWVVRSPAWRLLSPDARAVYLELKDRFNGHNNGSIGLGAREAGEAINVGRNVANRALQELEGAGFIAAAEKGAFRQNGRRATDWLLTELPDDRTGHAALKTFMSRKNVSPTSGTVSPTSGTQNEKKERGGALRPTSGTVTVKPIELASPQRDTSRSTIPPVAGSEQNGHLHSAGHTTTPSVSPQIEGVPSRQEIMGNSHVSIGDDERALLRWMLGYKGMATHRTSQQNLSGVLKGDAIASAAENMASAGLISIERVKQSRIYRLLPPARDPALLQDPDQFHFLHSLGREAP